MINQKNTEKKTTEEINVKKHFAQSSFTINLNFNNFSFDDPFSTFFFVIKNILNNIGNK